ncbi:hypothetical protein MTO96_020436 [Rhipicephalus appendiculatus]
MGSMTCVENPCKYHSDAKCTEACKQFKKLPHGYCRGDHCECSTQARAVVECTSNWTPGYFINTGGVGLIMDQSASNETSSQPIREQLNSVFERDWNSPYARWL